MSSAPEAQLEWEARLGKLAAAAALGSAAIGAAALVVRVGTTGAPSSKQRETLIRVDEHQSEFLLSFGLQAASYALLAAALLYLLRATAHRRPELPRFTPVLLLLAPVLLAVGGLLDQLDLNSVADEFISSGARSEARAEDLLENRAVVGGAVFFGGTLCLALSFVLLSLNAMRAGLLSRFMGVLGVIVGGLLVLPLLPGGQTVVQIFWVAALGMLFLGRWPGGRGPAWETGEPIPWPSAADAREDEVGEASEDVAGEQPRAEEPEPVARRRSRKKKRR